ncbi:MAG: DUF3566 domain-containing protein [Acidimicrobiales bacterium]
MADRDNLAGVASGERHRNGRSPGARSARPKLKPTISRLRTRGVVRKVDAWSVLKISVVFYVAVYFMLLVAAVLLWTAATATGLRGNIEKVVADLIASGKFHFVGSELLQAGAIGGAVLVVLGTAANVMLVVLYNLISDLVGGLVIVVEAGPGREPALRSGTEPAPPASTQPPRLLIPDIERQALRPTAVPPARPEMPDQQLSGAERAAEVNVEGLGL